VELVRKLNGFFGENILSFYNLFPQSATLPVYVSVSSFANLHFFYPTIFQKLKTWVEYTTLQVKFFP